MTTTGTVYRSWLQFTHLLLGPCNWRNGDITLYYANRSRDHMVEYKIPYETHIDIFKGPPEIWDKALQTMRGEECAGWLVWLYFTLSTVSKMKEMEFAPIEQQIGAVRFLMLMTWREKTNFDSIFHVFTFWVKKIKENSYQARIMARYLEQARLVKVTSYRKFVPKSIAEIVDRHLDKRNEILEYKDCIEKWMRAGMILDCAESQAQYEAMLKMWNEIGLGWEHTINPPRFKSSLRLVVLGVFHVNPLMFLNRLEKSEI